MAAKYGGHGDTSLQIDYFFPREVVALGTGWNISHFGFGFLLGERKIGTQTLTKQFTFSTPDFADDIRRVAVLLFETTTQSDIGLER